MVYTLHIRILYIHLWSVRVGDWFVGHGNRLSIILNSSFLFSVFSTPTTTGFCQQITFRPLNAEVCLSLDGLSIIRVKFGQRVLLEIQHPEDALLTGY